MLITNKTLYSVCTFVEEGEDVTEIAKDMLNCIHNHPERHGVGLAANQIGYDKRIILLNTPTTKTTMVNPVITKVSKQKTKQNEGCLSFPADYLVMVERYKQITVEWTTLQGRSKKQKFRDLDARVIQHEIDHLNGITIESYI